MDYFDRLPPDRDPDGGIVVDYEAVVPALQEADRWLVDRGFTVEPHIQHGSPHPYFEVLDRQGKTFAWGKTALAAVEAAKRAC